MRTITVCLTNYRRPQNTYQILAALRAQAPPVDIYLWNNGDPERFPADWLVESSRNTVCLSRWWMACHAKTQLVVILDDDVFPARADSLARLAACCQPQNAVGPIGAIFDGKYSDHLAVRDPQFDTPADVIKGRCLALYTDTLRQFVGTSGILTATTDNDLSMSEDIAICGAIAGGQRGRHLVPGGLAGLFTDLPEGPEALSHRFDHMTRRNRVAARWFK